MSEGKFAHVATHIFTTAAFYTTYTVFYTGIYFYGPANDFNQLRRKMYNRLSSHLSLAPLGNKEPNRVVRTGTSKKYMEIKGYI